ncbi:helix-turn-helix domain-containing protein, partial [Vibrio sp. FNV 38]|nr:helix-turn-helix domain-containing protein [Vibrio sp. FNV 38]
MSKLLLLKLADTANVQGLCYPSHQHLATSCEMSLRTVQRHLDKLITLGVVRKVQRFDEHGNQRSNVYQLRFDRADPPEGMGNAHTDNRHILNEQVINKQVINKQVINEQTLNEQVHDEQVLNENRTHEHSLNPSSTTHRHATSQSDRTEHDTETDITNTINNKKTIDDLKENNLARHDDQPVMTLHCS